MKTSFDKSSHYKLASITSAFIIALRQFYLSGIYGTGDLGFLLLIQSAGLAFNFSSIGMANGSYRCLLLYPNYRNTIMTHQLYWMILFQVPILLFVSWFFEWYDNPLFLVILCYVIITFIENVIINDLLSRKSWFILSSATLTSRIVSLIAMIFFGNRGLFVVFFIFASQPLLFLLIAFVTDKGLRFAMSKLSFSVLKLQFSEGLSLYLLSVLTYSTNSFDRVLFYKYYSADFLGSFYFAFVAFNFLLIPLKFVLKVDTQHVIRDKSMLGSLIRRNLFLHIVFVVLLMALLALLNALNLKIGILDVNQLFNIYFIIPALFFSGIWSILSLRFHALGNLKYTVFYALLGALAFACVFVLFQMLDAGDKVELMLIKSSSFILPIILLSIVPYVNSKSKGSLL